MGLLTALTIKKLEFKTQDGGRPPFGKQLNCQISATVLPILMKFGTVMHIGPLNEIVDIRL